MSVTWQSSRTSTPIAVERFQRLAAQLLVERAEHAVLPLDEDDLARGRVDGAEVVAQRVHGRVRGSRRPSRRRSARRRPRRTSAVGLVRPDRLRARPLERGEHAAADLGRVLDRLQPRGELAPIRRGRSSGASSRWRRSASRTGSPRRPCKLHRLRRSRSKPSPRRAGRACCAAAEDRPQRRGDVGRRQAARRDLVQQRLEEVEVAAVDEVTSTGCLFSPCAASRPPNPPPTMTTL